MTILDVGVVCVSFFTSSQNTQRIYMREVRFRFWVVVSAVHTAVHPTAGCSAGAFGRELVVRGGKTVFHCSTERSTCIDHWCWELFLFLTNICFAFQQCCKNVSLLISSVQPLLVLEAEIRPKYLCLCYIQNQKDDYKFFNGDSVLFSMLNHSDYIYCHITIKKALVSWVVFFQSSCSRNKFWHP